MAALFGQLLCSQCEDRYPTSAVGIVRSAFVANSLEPLPQRIPINPDIAHLQEAVLPALKPSRCTERPRY